VVPLRTCSPCPVRRRTVARLVGALVHEQGPPEWGVHVSPARRFQHLVDPSRRTERPETAAAHQRATTPRALRDVRSFTDANHGLKVRSWVAAVAARRSVRPHPISSQRTAHGSWARWRQERQTD
jgi:hypothetical protein